MPAWAQADRAATSPLRSLAVLDIELVDDQNNPLTKAAQELRLRNATEQLQHKLTQRRLCKSVDMRGNDNVSWTRGVRYLVRDMAEKRERNPKYAQ